MRGLFGKFRKTERLISKEVEYELYAQVSDQNQQGPKETGVWAKAFADAKGDEQKAEAIYIELMVERLVLAKQAEMEIASNSEQLNHKRTYKDDEKDGEKDGPWVTYWKSGQLSYEGNWKDGKRGDGLWAEYHSNGKLSSKGNYKDGQKDGPWVSYTADGTVRHDLTGTFKDGVKVE
jgi:hypothetical protein